MNELVEDVVFYVGLPLLASLALGSFVALGGEPARALFRAWPRSDAKSNAPLSPWVALALDLSVSLGATIAASIGTAMALGGAAVLPWVWLFSIVVATLRYGEVFFTLGDGESVTLTQRLERALGPKSALARSLGALAFVSVAACAVLAIGPSGEAIEVAGPALRTTMLATLAVAGVAAVGAIVAKRPRAAQIAGGMAVLGLACLVLATATLLAQAPAAAFRSLLGAFGDALEGPPPLAAFAGATAGEAARAAVGLLLPRALSSAGATGAIHALGRSANARSAAATSMLSPLLHGVILTLVVMAVAGSGQLSELAPGEAKLEDLTVYLGGFESASQRREPERLYDGYMRIVDGRARDLTVRIATDRGLVENPRFELRGEPANVGLRLSNGQVSRVLLPNEGSLELAEGSTASFLVVKGEMLAHGPSLLLHAYASAGELTELVFFVSAAFLAVAALLALGLALPESAGVRDRVVRALPIYAALLALLRFEGADALFALAATFTACAVAIAIFYARAARSQKPTKR